MDTLPSKTLLRKRYWDGKSLPLSLPWGYQKQLTRHNTSFLLARLTLIHLGAFPTISSFCFSTLSATSGRTQLTFIFNSRYTKPTTKTGHTHHTNRSYKGGRWTTILPHATYLFFFDSSRPVSSFGRKVEEVPTRGGEFYARQSVVTYG